MHLFALLSKTAREHPELDAFISEDARCTFSADARNLTGTRRQLHEQGIRHGMHIALLCRNGIPFVNTAFALLRLGAVCVPLNWRLTPSGTQRSDATRCRGLPASHDEDCQKHLPPVSQLRSLC